MEFSFKADPDSFLKAEPTTVATTRAAPLEDINAKPIKRTRNFWQAGEQLNVTQKACRPALQYKEGVGRSRLHPKFLHANATSHEWALGAIAELLDNAYDEDQSTYVLCNVEINPENGEPMLVVMDDGGGMDHDGLHRMLSFGICTKEGRVPGKGKIGQYGNGFKSSTMRLGSDALVFTRSRQTDSRSIGLLSYTFLQEESLEDVIVPMVSWDKSGQPMDHGNRTQWSENLALLMKWSPYKTVDALLENFGTAVPGDDVYDYYTRIVIYNLWQNEQGQLELDFDFAKDDIRLRPIQDEQELLLNNEVAWKYKGYKISLMKYIAVLYRNVRSDFDFLLRGHRVKSFKLEENMIHMAPYSYMPSITTMTDRSRKYTINVGFAEEMEGRNGSNSSHIPMGFLLYHRQRLIKAYWEVFKGGSSVGKGVIGILDVDFIQPSHNKQDFQMTAATQRLENQLKKIVKRHWTNYCAKLGYQVPQSSKKPHRKKVPHRTQGEDPSDSEGDGVEVTNDNPPVAMQKQVKKARIESLDVANDNSSEMDQEVQEGGEMEPPEDTQPQATKARTSSTYTVEEPEMQLLYEAGGKVSEPEEEKEEEGCAGRLSPDPKNLSDCVSVLPDALDSVSSQDKKDNRLLTYEESERIVTTYRIYRETLERVYVITQEYPTHLQIYKKQEVEFKKVMAENASLKQEIERLKRLNSSLVEGYHT